MNIYSTIQQEIERFRKDVPNANVLFYVDMSPTLSDNDDDEFYVFIRNHGNGNSDDDEIYIFIKNLGNGKVSVRTYTFNEDNLPVASSQDTLEAKYLSRYLKDIYNK